MDSSGSGIGEDASPIAVRTSGPSTSGGTPWPRWPFAVLAYLFAALALLGIAVPGLPTTPFVLLAAWAASRGSRRLHDWLLAHPRLGPPLVHWRDERAVSPRAKALAITFLIVSWAIMLGRGAPPWVLVALAALFVVVGTFVGTRPRPAPAATQAQARRAGAPRETITGDR